MNVHKMNKSIVSVIFITFLFISLIIIFSDNKNSPLPIPVTIPEEKFIIENNESIETITYPATEILEATSSTYKISDNSVLIPSADTVPIKINQPTITNRNEDFGETTISLPSKILVKSISDISKTATFNIKKMLDTHNTVRKNVNLTPLLWSNTLAQSSQEWAATLVSQNCKPEHDPNTLYGENLYWSWISQSDNDSLISTPEEAVTWWANEDRYYNYEKNTCRIGKDCGHYTQIVWRTTTEVGCGVSTCFDGDIQTDIWVCRYNPPGNDGTRPY